MPYIYAIVFTCSLLLSSGFADTINMTIDNTVVSTKEVETLTNLLLAEANVAPTAKNKKLFAQSARLAYINAHIRRKIATRAGITLSRTAQAEKVCKPTYSNSLYAKVVKRRKNTCMLWHTYVQEILAKNITVSPKQIRAFAKNRRLRKVFLITMPANEQTRILMQYLYNTLKKGHSFATLAAYFSNRVTSAKNGDLGWVYKESQPYKIERMLWGVQPRHLSPIFTAGNSYVLLTVQAEKHLPSTDTAKALPYIKRYFLQREIQAMLYREYRALHIQYRGQ